MSVSQIAMSPGEAPADPSKIWVNSGDSHAIEPEGVFDGRMASGLAARMPRTVKDPDGRWETVTVDGHEFRRKIPRPMAGGEFDGLQPREAYVQRAPGANDPELRLVDLDQEGVWAEVIFPSLGLWAASIRDPRLLREGVRALNDWTHETFSTHPDRYVPVASVSLLDVEDAVAELQRARGLGFRAIFMPPAPPTHRPEYNDPAWEPLWSAAEEAAMVVAFHVGTEPVEEGASNVRTFRGLGGAVLNYVETSYGGQRAATKLVASGVLDRHPTLKVFVAEGGAAWGPFVGDRMDEAYRQHAGWAEPKLSMTPKEFIYRQVYASFQHDPSAVETVVAMGWNNVLWGSDYPHLEGTFGHTQETLHGLFDGVSDRVRHRITIGAFCELFPGIGEPPQQRTPA
jgi:predicted TIM-barrel fold metal-dependent hydrolase